MSRAANRAVAHIEPLTVMRGVLAWWVVCYHFREAIAKVVPSWFLHVMANGDLAVDAFFVLSGFVLYLNHADRVVAAPLRGAVAFYVARVARVYPLHLFMLVCFIPIPFAIRIFSSAREIGERYDLGYLFMSVLLVQNWGFTTQFGWNVPSWSISTEMFAYFLFPIIALYFIRPIRSSPCALFAVGMGSAVGMAVLFSSLGAASLGSDIPKFGLLRCVAEFVIGCSVGALVCVRPRQSWGMRVLMLAGVAAALLASFLGMVPNHWLMPAAFGVLIYALASGSPTIRDHRLNRFLIWLGQISYATYMVHYFMKDVVRFAMPALTGQQLAFFLLYLALTLLMSAACYYAIELPAGRIIKAWMDRRLSPARVSA